LKHIYLVLLFVPDFVPVLHLFLNLEFIYYIRAINKKFPGGGWGGEYSFFFRMVFFMGVPPKPQALLRSKVTVTNRRPLYRNRELVYWLRAIPRPEVSSGFMSEALSNIMGSILGSIARY
jgi:hypothetical protein